ncbi:hypothetical protein C8J56DRAFT_1076876 [Mycena floridula]|nr:hypothetical protein C8J56DRAFT_1076876 [Mycena floridula]
MSTVEATPGLRFNDLPRSEHEVDREKCFEPQAPFRKALPRYPRWSQTVLKHGTRWSGASSQLWWTIRNLHRGLQKGLSFLAYQVLYAFHSENLTWHDRCTGWELHEPATETAKSLIIVAGLDPFNLLAREFDEVHHFIGDRNTKSHLTPPWGLLTPEFTEYIKARDVIIVQSTVNHTSSGAPQFRMSRTSNSISNFPTLLPVIASRHGILFPKPDIDFIRFFTRHPRSIIGAYVNKCREYCCRLCPPESNPRTQTLQGHTSHLKLTHKKNSVDDEDWYKPQIILRISTS